MADEVTRINAEVMSRLRKHIAIETEGKMYGQIGKTIETAIEEYLSKTERGNIGEEKGINYLRKHGFKIIETNQNNSGCPYDVLAKKNEILYAINIKSAKSKKGVFGVQVSHISRLIEVCEDKKVTMGFLMAVDNDYALFLFNVENSNWSKPTSREASNQKGITNCASKKIIK